MSKSKFCIAIVGSAYRFPGSPTSPSKLRNLLKDPKDIRTQFDPENLNLSRSYDSNGEVHGATYVNNRAFLLLKIDSLTRRISLVEAEAAGNTLNQMRGSKASVNIGVMTGDPCDIQMRDFETVSQYCATRTGRIILSNLVIMLFVILRITSYKSTQRYKE
ncbi:uncharacterized protein MCYG_08754 [Microsporum canis CBS 113480]|uniref:Beta-ketoacyl synthase-like N-terminal domain-containing protein n=1 Tax=Arthroderma otae (strain ATCC MYA-4605 / CBS 113480) TaxID=554155 RepID=C5G1D2_ARTOC|nr:uncharacterized protein MCYG_08754 [Microsporum canis CBS 113480]EEQ28595.1 predicted protein [Microsporum canis CBS 113480]